LQFSLCCHVSYHPIQAPRRWESGRPPTAQFAPRPAPLPNGPTKRQILWALLWVGTCGAFHGFWRRWS
jgi:hypothetical protein